MEDEIESILLAMTEEHEHTRRLSRHSKNAGPKRRCRVSLTYLCAPRPPRGLLSRHHPHPAPREYQENDPWPVRTGREDRSATSPPKVVQPRGGPAGSTWCSLGLASDPSRMDGGRGWRQCIFLQRGDKRRSLNALDLIRRGRRDAPSVTAHLISRPRGERSILTTDCTQKGQNNGSLKVDYLCGRRAAGRGYDRARQDKR